MAKKKAKFNENSQCRGALRRVFVRSPVIKEVMLQARREVPRLNKDGSPAKKPAVQYQCNLCQSWRPSNDVAVDHKEPVVSLTEGFVDWNTFMERLFCSADNLQVVCSACHDLKSAAERVTRKANKKSTQKKSEPTDDCVERSSGR